MYSNQVLASAIITFLAFLINGAVMFLVLLRGRQTYHYLFAAALAAFAIMSLSLFLFYIRNTHPEELIVYFSITQAISLLSIPCIYHFTCSYLRQPRKKSTIFIWAYTIIVVMINLLIRITGMSSHVINEAEWGNYIAFHGDATGRIIASSIFAILLFFVWYACWFLFRACRRNPSPLSRHHILYILISFLIISLIFLTLFLFHTELEGYWLISPIRGLVTAAFGALIGIAIIKERLFDITVIIKKTTIYSIFLALIIFIFSLSEHLLATYVGKIFGENSVFIHIISIAVVIAILMPVRQRVERAIERFFAKKKVEF